MGKTTGGREFGHGEICRVEQRGLQECDGDGHAHCVHPADDEGSCQNKANKCHAVGYNAVVMNRLSAFYNSLPDARQVSPSSPD